MNSPIAKPVYNPPLRRHNYFKYLDGLKLHVRSDFGRMKLQEWEDNAWDVLS